MNDDAELLRAYAEKGSDSAFTELVRRHIDLVYNAALRRVDGDPHRAADVAQRVFTTLAQQATKLSHHTLLPAWLHTATRNAALNLVIADHRRKAREVEAFATASPERSEEAALDWDRLRPVLDEAIDELPGPDRAAVIARFFERKPFAELGMALNISADAARMRTERSLDKLRGLLARRGITSTAVALEALVASQPLLAAPGGLATTLATQALATAGAGVGLFGTLLIFMNAKIITAVGLSALVALAAGFYLGEERTISEPLPPMPETTRQTQLIASLRQENLRMKVEVERLNLANQKLNTQITARPQTARIAPTPPTAPSALPIGQQQKAMLNNLRQIAAALDQYRLEYGHSPSSMDDLVGEKKYIRRLVAIDGENYASVSLSPGQALIVTTTNGVNVVYDPSGNNSTIPVPTPAEQRANELGHRLEPAGKKAFEAYAASHNGSRPSNLTELIPYFTTPQEGADFVEFLEAQKEAGR